MTTTIENQEYWLGLRMNGERYALAANSIQAVFLHPEPEQSIKDLRISGVVVHEGEPIYLRNHFQVLHYNRRAENLAHWQQVLKQGQAPWIVVLKNGLNQGLGFRVNNISGPFHAEVLGDSPFINHNGSDYYLVEAA